MSGEDRKFKITLSAPKARQGVPAQLASRYMEKTPKPKKGKGSYTRKDDYDVEF